MFAMAEQEIESALAGMINSAAPVATLVIAFMLGNRDVTRQVVLGIILGFGGVVLMAWPSLVGVDAPVAAVLFVVLAVLGYGVTTNVIVPLQQRHGGLAVVAWAQGLSALLLLPLLLIGIDDSDFSTKPVVAVLILGVLGTGLARALSATLFGRAGAQRGSVVTYFVPIVAIVLGVVVRDESIEVVQLCGLGLVLFAGYLVARR